MLFGRLFAARYDRSIKQLEEAGLAARRRRVLGDLAGDVLEVGAGTGLNLAHYPEGVRLVLLEPDPHMRRRLEEKLASAPERATVVDGKTEDLPFADETFDAVVSTLVLCSVDDLERSLAEIRRVLRPAGRLIVIEHVRGEGARAFLQETIAPPSRLLLACSPNRRTAEAIRAAGFDLQAEAFELPAGPPWVKPAIQGVAVKAAGSALVE